MNRIVQGMFVIAGALGVLLAQDQNPNFDPNQQPQQPDGAYEPGRAVARISVMNGDVSVRRGDSGEVIAAAVNGPLMGDDRILTGQSGRAEVELDFANVVRVGPNAELRFAGMDVRSYQMQLAAGTVTLRVLRPGQAQTEIDTPSVAVHPLQPGIYRITVHEDGISEITVRTGEAEIYSSNGSERLAAGQTMNARGSGPDTEFQVVRAVAPDSWDRWNEDRDRYLERTASYQHVSPDITGAEDLDQNGRWVQDPTYGQVWTPDVPPGWAPYQNGQWVWEDYYGWTWVSYDPWGWAPYHYGRWFWGVSGWAWYPGPMYARAYWSPALVGFFGWGGRVGVGFGFAGVGWVPLAPYEAFHPWWGAGYYGGFRGGAFGGTTIVNNVNVYNTYRNARVAGGVVGINSADFGRRAQFTSLNRAQVQNAGLVRGAVPIAPDRTSLRMTNRAASGNFAPSRATSFTSHMQAPRVEHVSFEQQQRGFQQMSRSGFSGTGAGTGQGSGFSRGTASGNGGGWRRVGDAGTNGGAGTFNRSGSFNGAGSSAGAPSQTTHEWGRFGEPLHQNSSNGAVGNWRTFQTPQPGNSAAPATNFARGSQPVRISPSIVQPRPGNSAPNYGGGRNDSNYGGGRPSGGGGHASSGGHGGGGHSGGGHR